jgi:hypothetical protein
MSPGARFAPAVQMARWRSTPGDPVALSVNPGHTLYLFPHAIIVHPVAFQLLRGAVCVNPARLEITKLTSARRIVMIAKLGNILGLPIWIVRTVSLGRLPLGKQQVPAPRVLPENTWNMWGRRRANYVKLGNSRTARRPARTVQLVSLKLTRRRLHANFVRAALTCPMPGISYVCSVQGVTVPLQTPSEAPPCPLVIRKINNQDSGHVGCAQNTTCSATPVQTLDLNTHLQFRRQQ